MTQWLECDSPSNEITKRVINIRVMRVRWVHGFCSIVRKTQFNTIIYVS